MNADRFWSRVDRSAGPFGCWQWTGAQFRDRRVPVGNGYGMVQIADREYNVSNALVCMIASGGHR